MSLGLGVATLGAGFLNTAGSVYANAVNSATQQRINDQNAQLQWAINADQIEAARMNNETAVNLANTAHQREVMDLRDANLNPILSASGNGSAVPSLDTPGLEAPQLSAPTVENPLHGLANALSTAVQVNDQHSLNEARLAVLGFGDSSQRKELADSLASRTIAEANSAEEVAHAKRDEAQLAQLKTALEAHALTSVTGKGAPGFVYGKDWLNDKSEWMQLLRQGILAELRERALKNTGGAFSSAMGIVDLLKDSFNK